MIFIKSLLCLVVTEVHSTSTFQVTSTIEDNTVTATKFNRMSADDGDTLTYNKNTLVWEPQSKNGINYRGIWDATIRPDGSANLPSTTPAPGDYYCLNRW